ncbi:MAG: YajD family HNH nuclease [Syntrophales bacterium]|jgi:hypothetical protein|nr:YajD family HNH nuclease [Syntrophales bacterium]MCK9390534.1 YajD family HNH nuclease [Syntrophales bacterium]
MGKMTFGNKGGRVRAAVQGPTGGAARPVEDVVRELKKANQKPPGEDYRERSLTIHGLVCARCAREFSGVQRQLLTVHHKDGNHHNNPPDGSNWENLCVYCHDDTHSRSILGDYLEGAPGLQEIGVAYRGAGSGDTSPGRSVLGEKLQQALQRKK